MTRCESCRKNKATYHFGQYKNEQCKLNEPIDSNDLYNTIHQLINDIQICLSCFHTYSMSYDKLS